MTSPALFRGGVVDYICAKEGIEYNEELVSDTVSILIEQGITFDEVSPEDIETAMCELAC